VSRGRGGFIFLSSGSALRGTALTAGYAATKAWNLVLAESLWDELREAGVDVMAVVPGPTRTPGFLSSAPPPGPVTENPLGTPEAGEMNTISASPRRSSPQRAVALHQIFRPSTRSSQAS